MVPGYLACVSAMKKKFITLMSKVSVIKLFFLRHRQKTNSENMAPGACTIKLLAVVNNTAIYSIVPWSLV
jgi:hypothetical protein